jgi:putative nucleotidyltransferase with HDIG domain
MLDTPTDMRELLTAARLPTMPQILMKLLQICQSDDADMVDIAKLIATDTALTARILGVANSAAYQREGNKSGLVFSINVLGLTMVKSLLISESVYQTFSSMSGAAQFDLSEFWQHALSTAVIARDLAKKMAYPQVEEAYLAGLLHDVGRLALMSVAPSQYGSYFFSIDDVQLCAAEMLEFQTDHTKTGAWIVERWNLDSFMADSVRYHHEERSSLQSAPPLIRIVHLAHWLAAWPIDVPLPVDAGTLCNVTPVDLESIRQRSAAQVEKSAAFIGVALPVNSNKSLVGLPLPVADPIRHFLNEEVRDMALLSEWQRSLARVTESTQRLTLIRQNAQIYFHLDDSLIFLLSGDCNHLMCVSASQRRQRLLDFSVSMSSGGSVAASVLQRCIEFIDSTSLRCTVAEDQLLRFLQTDGMVCIPLIVEARCLGVVIGAASVRALKHLKARGRFLQAFALHAAAAMDLQTREATSLDQHINSVRAEFRSRARGMAHEVNNPLSIIKSYLGVIDDKLARDESVDKELTVLNEELHRIGGIVDEFAGNQSPKPTEIVEINALVSAVVHLFQESRFLPPSVQIAAEQIPQACEIEGSAAVLRQILVNLIKNAVEAMPSGGRITVINRGSVKVRGRSHWSLLVNDSGPGMPANMLVQLFKPVKSSKVGHNRGIGLSIVHGLVQQLSGTIQCSSSTSGTSFEILLPEASTAKLGGKSMEQHV